MVGIEKEYWKKKDVRDIGKSDIIDFKRDCEGKFTWKEKTLKNQMDHFKVFMNYLRGDLELIGSVPQFPEIDVPIPQIPWLQCDDQISLYNLVADQDKPIIGFLMLHGCRPGEARAMKCNDVNLEMESITCHATFSKNVYCERRKGRKSRPYVIAIHPEIMGYVAEKVRTSLPEAFLFTNPRTGGYYSQEAIFRVWENVRTAAGISGITLYGASRHSFVSQLINLNISSSKVSQLTGHSSPRMIDQKYAHHDLDSLRTDLALMSLKKRETVTRLSLRKKGDEK